MTNLDKSRDITLPTKVCLVKAMVFPVVMYGCESWTVKKLSIEELMLLTVVLEKTLESPLDCTEIQSVHHKENQSWIFIGKTVEAETPILWPPDAKNLLIGEDPDVGKDWRQEEKGMTEDEMVGWHHWLNGLEFEQALGVGDRQGSMAYCIPWGLKESDMTDYLYLRYICSGTCIYYSNGFYVFPGGIYLQDLQHHWLYFLCWSYTFSNVNFVIVSLLNFTNDFTLLFCSDNEVYFIFKYFHLNFMCLKIWLISFIVSV